MRLNRRRLLLGAGAGLAALAGLSLASGLREHILRTVAKSFGESFAAGSEAATFAEDLIVRMQATRAEEYELARIFYRLRPARFPELLPQERKIDDYIATQFALASNVLQVIAAPGTEFVYLGLFDPRAMPCQNPLGAAWAV